VTAPSLGAADPHPEHSASFGEALRRRLASVGVEAVLVYPRAERAAYPEPQDFLIAKLRPSEPKRRAQGEGDRQR
ncbi:MAG TPA: hypothetical protein VNO26_09455, partial [Candidatus Limnocylindria bacterium]|nr:hypothetical protein [Candidatus Limnocylindria bacterium]